MGFLNLLVVIACCLAAVSFVSASSSLTVDEARRHIKESFASRANAGGSNLCDSNVCCNISSSETCSISNMKKDSSTLVLPGGNTRCIFSTSTPFAFQVIPGDSDNVLVYFQGGGACWDKGSTDNPMCTTDCVPQELVGIFDRYDHARIVEYKALTYPLQDQCQQRIPKLHDHPCDVLHWRYFCRRCCAGLQ
jgi:hypothetical protein